MFAKLYETKLGQILVKLDTGDNGAEVTVYFEPEGLGVCNTSLNWPKQDEDKQWENADKAFAMFTEEKATDFVECILLEFQIKGN